jgi:xylan 1,4-beta-xylosidase
MVYNENEYWLKTMDKEIQYYFVIEALNENGIGERSQIIKSE